jgi:drug/metabolite transporter (DMT)-like permease
MRTTGIAAGLAAAAIWGGMYVVSKVVLEVLPPFTLLSLRLILGAFALGLVLLFRRQAAVGRRQVVQVLGVGLLGFGVSVGLQFVGTSLSSAANAALITSASPVFILLFGALLLGEAVTARRLAALALAGLGVLAVLNPTGADLAQSAFRGNVVLIAAAVTWGLYSVLVKRASRDLGTTEVSFLAFLGGLILSLPLAAAEGPSSAGPITPSLVAGVLYLGLISTALAMYLWNRSLALLEAGLVSLLFFAQPVVGVSLSAWLLDERLPPSFWVGAAMIAAGLLLAAWPARRPAASAEDLSPLPEEAP